ncbi:TonB-dependent receptor [Qipengyuania sp. 6B39]|uniref:TonB-dependent receptor domain-containing protein n=1 Tax=Qipengyuania proteolytica TaxID=2867239 RepID=UPI001C8A6190|nr:TonB-dependent receptor [Qipengyuania proteolytica]MBX7496702.1 TonB-dependent receptor [Qipengyuania proteolytica]
MSGRVALFAGVGAAALLALPTQAFAQVAGPAEPVITDKEAEGIDEDTALNADGSAATNVITVTGSRIRLPEVQSRNPIFVVDESHLEDRIITNIADALNELPAYRGSVTPSGAQGSFGQGVNFVNNLGLGSNRNLTLVNGRRFVSSNVPSLFNNASQGVQVDLNVIPTILIDRIDTIGIGGAPVYGSDAISGTTNVILKTRFDDIVISGTSGITERGDNFRWNVSGAAGFNFLDDRANITVAVSHDEVEGVLQNARNFFRDAIETQANIPELGSGASAFRVNPNIGPDTGDDDGIPPSVRYRGITIPFLDRGGVIFGGPLSLSASFAPNGDLIPFEFGESFPGLGIRGLGGDGFRFSDFGQIESDLRRTVVNAFANVDILDNVTFFAEGTYFNSRAEELVQQPSFNTPLFGGSSGAVIFDINNPFLTDQARQTLIDNGVTAFQLSRVNLDLADTSGFGKNEILRGVAGFRGEFDALGRVFNFEASFNRGSADIVTVSQDINRQNFINAVNVAADANGNPVCSTAPTVLGVLFAGPGGTPIADPNCVPLNLLGDGRASDAARAYVIQDDRAVAKLDQTVFNFNIGSTLFDPWGAGPVGFNVGYEHRKEKAAFIPSEFQQEGLGRSVAIGPVSGSFNVDEVFGEVLFPLISPSNDFFIHSAEVSAQGRYVDNTVNGGFFAWSAGGRLAIVEDIEFRGNYTRSFRAPAVTELFQPANNAFSTVVTPCRPQDINNGPNPTARQGNCAAFMVRTPRHVRQTAPPSRTPIWTRPSRPRFRSRRAATCCWKTKRPTATPSV